MNKEIADKWVAALRSGNYNQGYLQLKNNDKYCCLGVLCDISNHGKWGIREGIESYTLSSFSLPIEVITWSGMHSSSGVIDGVGILSNLNDQGKTFEEISDIIEQNWEHL